MPERTSQRLEDHISESNDWKKEFRDDIKIIKENHLHHMEKDLACIKTKVDMLSKFFWLQIGMMISGFGGMFFTIFKIM